MQRFLNDTSQLARNLQQTKDEKDRVLQVLELMEEEKQLVHLRVSMEGKLCKDS